ncbi:MAG TPA: phosphate ABC transporter, permease protein PstA, partial [Marmoricola sp.]|nr:phosphate ABC transporter, permease protein PstA [Marmoricola sp.]
MAALETAPSSGASLRGARLPRYAPALAGALSVVAAVLAGLSLGWSVAGIVVLALLIYLVGLTTWSRGGG